MPKRRDITGMKFGYLLAVAPAGINKHKQTLWTFLCDCGKYKNIVAQAVIIGRTKSCGCKQKELQNLKKMKSDRDSSCKSLMGEYKKNAVKRGHSFELDFEQFKNLTSSNCFYCGSSPEQVYLKRKGSKSVIPYYYNGVDRLDNKKGYTKGNVVSCCGICNKMKLDSKFQDFLNKVVAIYNKHSYTESLLRSEI